MIPRLAIVLFATLGLAQEPSAGDPAALQRELDHMFDRPAGTVIGDTQRENLRAFVGRHGEALGELGYATALLHYLDRDYEAAVRDLDGFFAAGHLIANAEHRTMAGRVYLNAVSREARAEQPDVEKLARWSESMTRLYRDTAMLERFVTAVAPRLRDAATLRVALARGVFASDLPVEQQDSFLRALYGAATAGAADAAQPAARGYRAGQEVEPFATLAVLNGGDAPFDLKALRGKVVVLDFFATWCPPCRAGVKGLIELQAAHQGAVQVVGVTRFHGRGMEFAPGDELPHGGKPVDGLDRDRELAVNRAFVTAFEPNYPLVFVADDVARERFGVTGIPALFVIGRDGRLVGGVVGNSEAKHQELLGLIERALR